MLNGLSVFLDKYRSFHPVLLAITALLVGVNSLFNGFVWDDRIYLLGNRALLEFDLREILLNRVTGIEYFPVRDLSLALDYLMWGEDPFGFHLTSLLLYALNCIAVYYLAASLDRLALRSSPASSTGKTFGPLLVALLFAVHPLHAEVFNWITCRGALLSGLFSFISCYAFLRYLDGITHPFRYLIISIVCFALALLSKAYCITVPLVLTAFIFLHPDWKTRRLWYSIIPFLVFSLVAFIGFSAIGTSSNVITGATQQASGLAARISLALQIPFFYLWKFIAPVNLSAEYQNSFALSLTELKVLSAAALWLAAIFGLFTAIRKRSATALIVFCWFGLTMLPLLNVFATHPVVADRYAYLPSFALCYCTAKMLSVTAGSRQRIFIPLTALLLLVWGALTMNQNRAWFSDRTLWEQATKVKPTAYAHVNLGDHHFWRGEYDRAFANFNKARELAPGNTKIFLYKGYYLYQQKDYKNAIGQFEKLLATEDSIMGRYFMGMAQNQSGDRIAAIDSFRKVLVSKDMDPQGYYRRSAADNLRRMGAVEVVR